MFLIPHFHSQSNYERLLDPRRRYLNYNSSFCLMIQRVQPKGDRQLSEGQAPCHRGDSRAI